MPALLVLSVFQENMKTGAASNLFLLKGQMSY